MNNIKFKYLYRDAGNYKKLGEVIFSNPGCLTVGAISRALGENFLPDGLFIAHQVHIPEVFLSIDGGVTVDDHCFHEFDEVEVSASVPNDKRGRSVSDFIADVKAERKRGWLAFDPQDRFIQGGSWDGTR